MDLKVEFVDLNKFNTSPNYYEDAIETAFGVTGLQVERQLQNCTYFVVAFADSIPCGVARFTLVDGRKTVYCLRQIYVNNVFRGKGIGYHIVENGKRNLKKLGATKILSFILQNNHASRKLHHKCGFKNSEKGCYDNSFYDAYGEMDEMWVNKL